MQAFAAILAAFGALGALTLLSACGDDGDDGGSGGAAGASAGGSSSGSGGKASGGAASGGSSSGGSSSGGSGGGASGDVCADAQALASERQNELNCANGTGNVEAACTAALMEFPDCEDEYADIVDCGQALAASAWVCDADGTPSTPDGTCTDELTALEDCLGL